MRTTVTLDPDVDALIQRTMRERQVSFRQALNDAVRVALAGRPHIAPYRLAAVDMGAPTIDLTKALALADALEDSELVRKMDSHR